eukprot:GSMAST32.ASY1.ANO1.750.1 assembled CDS
MFFFFFYKKIRFFFFGFVRNFVPNNFFFVTQDEDVLDTWFSSSLLPLSALGWPNNNPNATHSNRYPLDVMETGSRMAMICSELNPNPNSNDDENRNHPFNRILLHPMVRDRSGRKMSKSLGNVIDPNHVLYVINGISLQTLLSNLEIGNLNKNEIKLATKTMKMEFPQGMYCGSDALRFTLLTYLQQGTNINMDIGRVVTHRQFGNKIWQATKFALQHRISPLNPNPNSTIPTTVEITINFDTLKDSGFLHQWILSRLAYTTETVNKSLEIFDVSAAAKSIHSFIQNDLCGTFIEWSKPILNTKNNPNPSNPNPSCVMTEASLRLMHPFMPFITEELWQKLPLNNPNPNSSRNPNPNSSRNPNPRENLECLKNVSKITKSNNDKTSIMMSAFPTTCSNTAKICGTHSIDLLYDKNVETKM